MVDVKIKAEAVDPTGVVYQTQEMTLSQIYNDHRFVLTIGDHVWMVTQNGGYIDKITPRDEK